MLKPSTVTDFGIDLRFSNGKKWNFVVMNKVLSHIRNCAGYANLQISNLNRSSQLLYGLHDYKQHELFS